MLPSVISETVIQSFKFWKNGVQEGMCYQNDLYIQLRSYGSTERLKAYDFGCELSDREQKKVCVTCSDSRYVVWVSLRDSHSPLSANSQSPSKLFSTPCSRNRDSMTSDAALIPFAACA